MSADTQEFSTSITFTPTAAALTFCGGDTRVWLTISPDGIMAVGPGLSEDEATQRIAKMLAERYSTLHREQANALAAKDTALSEITAEHEAARQNFHTMQHAANALRQRAENAEDALSEMRAELERVAKQRDNLWMAYLHSKMCFHGGIGSSNPDQQAHYDVDLALAGNGPKNVTALRVAKHIGRIPTRTLASQDEGEER